MKVYTPSIAWHNRERVSSADFQPVPYPDGRSRLATGGDDKHVVIWELSTDKDGKVEPQCLCDLSRHQNSVNIVRWSSNGRILASGDTDSGILLWQYSDTEIAPDLFGDEAEMEASDDQPPIRRENWVIFKTLRGHLQDVVDISWSACSTFLISCSTDNTAIVFDTQKDKKVKILGDHKGWVNGVAWDPADQYIASIASDRCLRLYKTKNYKIAFKTYKASLPVGSRCKEGEDNKENVDEEKVVRLFHDDTFQSFYRRLAFSPDGEILAVPSGVLEVEGETSVAHCTYLFTKYNLAKPALYLPTKEFSVVVRFSPVKYELRPVLRENQTSDSNLPPWEKYETLFCLPYRMVYAVATQNTVVLYDTQQAEPFAKISKIHYVGLNDLAWSADGNSLIICSTDGYCTIANFEEKELGKVYAATELHDAKKTDEPISNGKPEETEPIKELVNKEGIQLDSEGVASPARIHIRSVEGGKPNPTRLQLITLSSPKHGKEDKTEKKEVKVPISMDDECETCDLTLKLEDDDDTMASSTATTTTTATPIQTKKRATLLPVDDVPTTPGQQPSKSPNSVSKVGRRVNLITLTK